MALLKLEDRRGKMNRIRTNSLFLETITTGSLYTPEFTLKDEDITLKGKVYPSIKKIYMETSDPTEYQFVMEVFGEWAIWKRILDNKTIMTFVQVWRDELEVKMRSEAVGALLSATREGGTRGIAAAKYVAERGWVKHKPGGVTKKERDRRNKVIDTIDAVTEEDAVRMGLH